ncbi:MAG: PBECR4 domain-containing protein [Streptococcus sp.]|nr:PBECR4 domain-containing protein [Streptococcus sp.]
MAEEYTQQSSSRAKSRRDRIEHARSRSILDVASELSMELIRSGRDYRWKEHDSMVISPDKNVWNWFSHNQGGDVIALVQTMKEINFNQAIDYLNDGTFKEFTNVERVQEPFSYYLEPYEQPFEAARSYLKDQRNISDETIDFFLEKGVLAQANAKVNGSIEPVIVFKSFDFSGEIVGATLQGIEENWEKWPDRGYAKNIVRNSDGITGMHVDIGQPNRLVFAESGIDLMSYYELHQNELQDVRLVSMDGLKESVVGRHIAQLQSDISGRPLRWSHDQLAEGLQIAIDNNFFADGKHADWITLAIDNDEAGRNFSSSLREKGAVVTEAMPDLQSGQSKTDWNDYLKVIKQDSLAKLSMMSEPITQTEEELLGQNKSHNLEQQSISQNQEQLSSDNSSEKIPLILNTDKVLKDYWTAYQSNGSLEFYLLSNGSSGTRQKGTILPDEKQIVFKYHSFSDATVWLVDNMGYDSLRQIVFKDWESLFDTDKSLLEECYVFSDLENFLLQSTDFEMSWDMSNESEKAIQNQKEKSLEHFQRDTSEQQKNERTSQYKGSLQPEAEGSTAPVSETDTFDRSVTSRPTKSSHYLNFTIKEGFKSRHTRLDHSVDKVKLAKLNRFSDTIQEAAQYYQKELANSEISYFTADGNIVQVNFLEKNFMHLTGLKFIGENQPPEKTLSDIATGGAISFDDIRISNSDSAFDKIKVLPELKAVLQTDSFYFDQLQNIDRYTDRFDSLIKSSDKDIMVLFKATDENGTVPASVFKSREILENELDAAHRNEIIGIFRKRKGILEQIAINEDYVRDGGQEMLSILQNHQYEEIAERTKSQSQAIDKKVLSQLENQELNQEIATEANEQNLNSKELLPEEDSSRGSFYSPNQEIKMNLAQRVEEIMVEDMTEILIASVPQIQESLSVEGDLVGTPQSNGQILYVNREYFGQDYQLELAVHSSMMVEQLSETQVPWTLALIKGEEKLGYVAYGSDWSNDFQIEAELKKLAEQIGLGKTPEELYKQEEVNDFLANNYVNELPPTPIVSDEPFDYTSASAYEISEYALQKIREYTQSPEGLMEYMDFMSKFPQLSPRNVALIHEQWRGANAVATFDQWQAMGETLGIKPDDVFQTKATYVNKRTGETKEVVHQGLSVKTGEKSKITLFRPLMVRMIPVLDESGNQVKNDKGNPKYKKLSEATPKEKALVKDGKLSVRQFQERDKKTGRTKFTTYKVFELSQTTLKPESYPKIMPNRHYNFNTDKVKTKEVLEGLCDYAENINVSIMKDEAHVLGNARGAFYPGEQIILINPDNTPGEKIATTIHELAHATLHNPKQADQYKELPKGQKELEAEMTSHLLSKHFGLDTSEKAIDYMAKWTDNLKTLDNQQLADSLKRVHKTVSKMLKQVESHTKPYQLGKSRGQAPNFPKASTKGPSR